MLAVSLPALVLGIACGVFYAAADTLRKAVPPTCPPETILFYYIAGHIPVLAAWAFWSGAPSIAPAYALPGLADAACGLAANLMFIIAIRRSAFSLMVPLLALVPVVTLLAAGALLGEWPTPRQTAGIVLITAGLFSLFQTAGRRPSFGGAFAAMRAERGTLPMLAVVALWSATPALDKICLAYTSPAMHSLVQVSLIWTALLAWAFLRNRGTLRISSGALPPVIGSAAAGAIAYGLQLLAYAVAMVALVELLKRTTGLLGSLLFGRTVFKEPVTRFKALGIVVIVLGLPLVMIS